jgi:hypothetical protein
MEEESKNTGLLSSFIFLVKRGSKNAASYVYRAIRNEWK